MKRKIVNFLKYSVLLLIPIISVLLCMAFRLAQGEKNEEIVFGVMVGIAIDLIYSIILLIASKRSMNK